MANAPKTTPEAWRGRAFLVVGMARSGRSVTRLLARHGARVRATDIKDGTALELDAPAFTDLGVDLRLGESGVETFDGIEAVVVSPGIPKTAPALVEARRRGLPIYSELEMAFQAAQAPMAALTGTNGKSTTVFVLGQLLTAVNRPNVVAGNVGLALSEVVETVPPHGALAVEVSSYQLEDIDTFHPRAAGLLNVTPDHLDRYDSMEHYAQTKRRIFSRQGPDDTAVIPAGDPAVPAPSEPGRVLTFGVADRVAQGVAIHADRLTWRDGARDHLLIATGALPLPGPHNQRNVAAALALLAGLGEDPTDPRILAALPHLRGLPHRLEPVGTVDGVTFINDSKATNPDSLEVALRAFTTPVVLIAGGLAKPSDYAALTPLIARHTRALVLIGEAAPALATAWAGAGVEVEVMGGSFAEAIEVAYQLALPDAASVLLSPGCASFDMFRDYEQRGEQFRNWVRGRGTV